MRGAETMTVLDFDEIVSSREQLYVPADIHSDLINCGDDRTSDAAKYIHVFGGALFVSYTNAVLQEVQRPGSASNLAALTGQVVEQLQAAGYEGLGVHSDTAAEAGQSFRADQLDGAVGCGYAGKRAAISQLISDNGESIMQAASGLLPDLFGDKASQDFGWQVVAAHGRLAERADSAIGDGRAVVRTANAAGAKMMLVSGSHVATEGIINTQAGSTFDTNAAHQANLAAYDHDLWASSTLLESLPNAASRQEATIASVIDVIGTMQALGVEHIAVR